MPVRVRDFFEQTEGLQLVAGGSGLDAPVRWGHMVETDEIAAFLRGEEVVFITGVAFSEGGDLYALIRAIYEESASAVVVNVGPYIESIPRCVIEFCNRESFPLFKIPWSTRIAELMHDLCFAILSSERQELELEVAIRNAIDVPAQEALYAPAFERFGIPRDATFSVACISAREMDEDRFPQKMRLIRRAAEDLIVSRAWKASYLEVLGRGVVVWCGYERPAVLRMCSELLNTCSASLLAEVRLYCGLGASVAGLNRLGRSYNQALTIQQLQKTWNRPGVVGDYAALGIYRLIMGIKDDSELEGYYLSTVGPLLDHDASSGDELAETLETYLRYGGSVSATADELYVHRNTVSYRIRKIESMLCRDLSNLTVREELDFAFHAREVIRARRELMLGVAAEEG